MERGPLRSPTMSPRPLSDDWLHLWPEMQKFGSLVGFGLVNGSTSESLLQETGTPHACRSLLPPDTCWTECPEAW